MCVKHDPCAKHHHYSSTLYLTCDGMCVQVGAVNGMASGECQNLMSTFLKGDKDREERQKQEYFKKLPNIWEMEKETLTSGGDLKLGAAGGLSSAGDALAPSPAFPPGSEGLLGRQYQEVGALSYGCLLHLVSVQGVPNRW